MNELREQIIDSYKNGNFLQAICQLSQGFYDVHNEFTQQLIQLNNEGTINVIAEFQKLFNTPDTQMDFFSIKYILEKSLPELNSAIEDVMNCILHYTTESKNDMTFGILFEVFMNFCLKDPERPFESLSLIKGNLEKWAKFIPATIVAGSKIDIETYLNEVILFTQHPDVEIRKNSILAIGLIDHGNLESLLVKSLSILESSAENEDNDDLLSIIIRSSFSLYKNNNLFLEKTNSIIEKCVLKGGDYCVRAVAEILGCPKTNISITWLELMLSQLTRENSLNKSVIDNIDISVVKLIKSYPPKDTISFIEKLFIQTNDGLSIADFSRAKHELILHPDLLNKTVTRWFLSNEPRLHRCAKDIMKETNHEYSLKIDKEELSNFGQGNCVFLAKKVVGYLFHSRPMIVANILFSLLEHCEQQSHEEILDILFYFLILGYPKKMRLLLEKNISMKNDEASINLLEKLDLYEDVLKRVGIIPELHPSQNQREAYYRLREEQMMRDLKKYESQSPILSSIPKAVFLYGNRCVIYTDLGENKYDRREIHMNNVTSAIEYPSQLYLKPAWLNYMIRYYRAEKNEINN